MLENLERIKEQFSNELNAANLKEELERIRVSFLGKKGLVTEALKDLRNLDAEAKKQAGMQVNLLKDEIEQAIVEYQKKME